MKTDTEDKAKKKQIIDRWRLCASAISIVAAVFSMIVIVVLLVNYTQTKLTESTLEVQMEELKLLAQEQPGNERLLETIRRLDLDFRQNNLRRWQFSHVGAHMLLVGVIVFLCGLVARIFLVHEVPKPGPQPDKRQRQILEALWGRWAIAGFCLVFAAFVVVLLITSPTMKLAVEEEDEPAILPPPTMEEYAANWYRFRGPGGAGICSYTDIPTKWDGKSGEGVVWKSEVPLSGNNSPVVWGDRIFFSGGDKTKLQVFCFDAGSGDLLWTGNVTMTLPKEEDEEFEVMEDTGYASNTMVTDGQRAYVIFTTGDLACFNYKGKKLWEKSLGIPDNAYGYASSLEMYKNLLLVQFDQADAESEMSKMLAFDGATGDLAWEATRPVANSWTSPIIVDVNGQPQLITVGDPWVMAYNPADGSEIWRAECVAGDVAPSPIYAGGLVFAIEPYSQLVAVKPDGKGNVTETHIAWRMEDGAPDICCPVSDGKFILMQESEGFITCYDIKDGKLFYEHDYRESFKASPSLVGDKVYLLSEKGIMYIIEAGAEYKEITKCELGEKCYASPAFSDGRIYIRGSKNFYCIGGEIANP